MPDPAAARRVRWTPLAAGTAAVLMALAHHVALGVACLDALSCMSIDFRRNRRVGRTYNGLMKALERQSDSVLPAVRTSLRERVRRRFERMVDIAGWTLLAVDGSKGELPRTRDHERCFGIADNGVVPQAFFTAIVEVCTGLLWDWRIDRAEASEKLHLMEMAPDLPSRALLLADANFVGFPIWSLLDRLNTAFLIRVGGNVRLITKLWDDACVRVEDRIVYVWPKKRQGSVAPLQLRLIRVGRGKKAVYLLTNVLESTRLPKKVAGDVYRLRWGVELFFRTLKRTFGFVKLRSKAARRARIEIEWALIALTIVVLMGIQALTRRGLPPRRLSPAQLRDALRRSLHQQHANTIKASMNNLNGELANCLKDNYRRKRSKKSRSRRRTRNSPKNHILKPPKIREATPHEQKLAERWASKPAA